MKCMVFFWLTHHPLLADSHFAHRGSCFQDLRFSADILHMESCCFPFGMYLVAQTLPFPPPALFVRTGGLNPGTLYPETHPQPFLFGDKVSLSHLGWSETCDPPASVSQCCWDYRLYHLARPCSAFLNPSTTTSNSEIISKIGGAHTQRVS